MRESSRSQVASARPPTAPTAVGVRGPTRGRTGERADWWRSGCYGALPPSVDVTPPPCRQRVPLRRGMITFPLDWRRRRSNSEPFHDALLLLTIDGEPKRGEHRAAAVVPEKAPLPRRLVRRLDTIIA